MSRRLPSLTLAIFEETEDILEVTADNPL